jgi:shikimate dehydrogenase
LTTQPTRFAGILGWPLQHTLSPAIHNAAFRSIGWDCVYLAWPVAPTDLPAAVRGLKALGAVGANVTMPHKEDIIQWLDDISQDAKEVGAVNTIENAGGVLIGHNTDVDGFKEFLRSDAGFDAVGKSALVLGSGGAARAVVKALMDLGAGSIAIAARREEKASELVGSVTKGSASLVGWDKAADLAGRSDVVVNATPVGRDGDDPITDAVFRSGQLVVDLLYDPPSTPLVERARLGGADAWGGVGMLVHQAAFSFHIWTGRTVPLEIMSAAAVRGIGAGR